MPEVVAELIELVEDHQVFSGFAEFPAFIEDFFDVGLRTGGLDGLAGDAGQPFETFLAHFFRQDGDRFAGQQGGVISTAAAVVAGGGPNGFLLGGVELPRHKAGHQAAKRCADFMGAGGEPLAHEGDDPRRCSCQTLGDFEIIQPAEQAAAGFGFVVPGDAEQVPGVQVPQANAFKFVLNLVGDKAGVAHLREGGDNDIAFPNALNGSFQSIG